MHGLTVIESLVAIAIIMLLGMGAYPFVTARKNTAQNVVTDNIHFVLNRAKNDALAGKNGQNFGVKFDTNSYTYFSGSSFNSSDPSNTVYSVDSNVQISNTFSGGVVIFSRLTGFPNNTGTTTITDLSNNRVQTVRVGSQGDITKVK